MRNFGSMDQKASRNANRTYTPLKTKQIIRSAFLLSIVIHVGTIIAFQGIFPVPWFSAKRRAYRVYLMRPPIKEIMGSSKEDRSAISQGQSRLHTKNNEATITLGTKDPTYHPYTRVLKDRIMNHWIYPASARENLIQGTLLIAFRVDRDGNLVDCHIARPSGHAILDTYALEAIKSANPFPPFPQNITVQYLNIKASFAYQLKFEP
jgi:TonB family protein